MGTHLSAKYPPPPLWWNWCRGFYIEPRATAIDFIGIEEEYIVFSKFFKNYHKWVPSHHVMCPPCGETEVGVFRSSPERQLLILSLVSFAHSLERAIPQMESTGCTINPKLEKVTRWFNE